MLVDEDAGGGDANAVDILNELVRDIVKLFIVEESAVGEEANAVDMFAGLVGDIVKSSEESTVEALFCIHEEAVTESLPDPAIAVKGLLGAEAGIESLPDPGIPVERAADVGIPILSPGYSVLSCIPVVAAGSPASCDVGIEGISVASEAAMVVLIKSANTPILLTPVVLASRSPTAALPAWTN
jgi:hypothetical protein